MTGHRIRTGLISSAAIVSLAITASGCGGAPSPAGSLMNKISGCGSIRTWGGFSLDNNTADEGSCELSSGTSGLVHRWTADQARCLDRRARLGVAAW